MWLENKYKASVNEYMESKQMNILPGCVKKKKQRPEISISIFHYSHRYY